MCCWYMPPKSLRKGFLSGRQTGVCYYDNGTTQEKEKSKAPWFLESDKWVSVCSVFVYGMNHQAILLTNKR